MRIQIGAGRNARKWDCTATCNLGPWKQGELIQYVNILGIWYATRENMTLKYYDFWDQGKSVVELLSREKKIEGEGRTHTEAFQDCANNVIFGLQ